MLGENKCGTFLYIPLFLALLAAFIILLIIEFRSIWGGGSIEFNAANSIYWEWNSPGPAIGTAF